MVVGGDPWKGVVVREVLGGEEGDPPSPVEGDTADIQTAAAPTEADALNLKQYIFSQNGYGW